MTNLFCFLGFAHSCQYVFQLVCATNTEKINNHSFFSVMRVIPKTVFLTTRLLVTATTLMRFIRRASNSPYSKRKLLEIEQRASVTRSQKVQQTAMKQQTKKRILQQKHGFITLLRRLPLPSRLLRLRRRFPEPLPLRRPASSF